MKRKQGLISICLLLALTAGAAGTGWSFQHMPEFYREALRAQPGAAHRKQQAEHFEQRAMRLVEDMQDADEWSQEFTEDQINSWLAEELPRHYSHWLPAGVSEPRIHFSEETLEVAFRYSEDGWETVVNARLKPRLDHLNRLSVEFAEARAGLVPMQLDNFLTELSQTLTRAGWDYEWVEHDGHRVIIVPLSGDSREQPVLETLCLRPGTLKLAGRRRFTQDTKLAKLLMAHLEHELLRQR